MEPNIIEVSDEVRKILALPSVGQIGMVVRDIEKAIGLYTDLFDIGSWEDTVIPEYTNMMYRGQQAKFRYKVALSKGFAPQWELIQPVEGPTVYDDDFGKNGEGLHHLGFFVNDIDARIKASEEIGIAVTQSGCRPEVRSKWAYFDTRFIAGVTMELIQKPY